MSNLHIAVLFLSAATVFNAVALFCVCRAIRNLLDLHRLQSQRVTALRKSMVARYG